ncbi:MAG: class I SAM-dependent methyltransferase [Caldilineaceae bacterium]|nr:class I SAM-dependent methyltransferase [Caldilineaceae bacterium]
MAQSVDESVLTEMADYYRARAPEYNEWWQRQGRYDRGTELNGRWFAEMQEVFAALEDLSITGDVLELAPGTGNWTQRLLATAATITAVDASAEMIAINRERIQSERVTYVLADLFTWQPDRQYDALFFGFWLSHVPHERLDDFFQKVRQALRPGGKLFFIDSLRESTATSPDQPLPAATSQIMTRKLNDGRSFAIVKNFFDPVALAAHYQAAGLPITIQTTANYFIYGWGTV